MRVALVCVDDLSVVQFCEGIIKTIRADGSNTVCVISDSTTDETGGHYSSVIKSWGAKHISVPLYRYISPYKDLRYAYRLNRIFRSEQVDLVINVLNKPSIYGSIAAAFSGARTTVTTLFGMGLVFSDNKSFRYRALRLILTCLYWLAFKLSDWVWFTNRADFEYFDSKGLVDREKVELTRFWVDLEAYAPNTVPPQALEKIREELGITSAHKVVVMVARMSWAKGVREFAEAAEELQERMPEAQFILVGPMDDGSPDCVTESYMEEITQLGNLHWLGFRPDVKELYALADVAVLPSYYREGGYPRGLTEPMAMGKPIITTDNPHCRDTVEDGYNGFIVPMKNSGELASAIVSVLSDEQEMTTLGENSRSKAEKEFDERSIVSATLDRFELL